jgi:hypothetical protein
VTRPHFCDSIHVDLMQCIRTGAGTAQSVPGTWRADLSLSAGVVWGREDPPEATQAIMFLSARRSQTRISIHVQIQEVMHAVHESVRRSLPRGKERFGESGSLSTLSTMAQCCAAVFHAIRCVGTIMLQQY